MYCLVGNKCDLSDRRKVSSAEAESFAASIGAKHFEVSALVDRGMILELASRLLSSGLLVFRILLASKPDADLQDSIIFAPKDQLHPRDLPAPSSGGG